MTLSIPNETIEQIIVRKIYDNYDYLALIADNFDKRWFENKSIRHIICLIMSFHKKYSKLPEADTLKLLIKKSVEKHPEFDVNVILKQLGIIHEMNISNDELFIKETVLKFIQNKAAYFAIMDNFDVIEQKKDVSHCIERLQKVAGLAFDKNLGFNYFAELEKHLDEIANPEQKLPTGFKQMDKVLNGGLPLSGRSLMIFMAPTGVGKSLFMGNLAVNIVKQNRFPLIITLEMPEHVYGTRISSNIAKLDINELQFNVDTIRTRVQNFKGMYNDANLVIKEFPPRSINCNHIIAYIEKLHKYNLMPSIIIVDYIGLLMPNKKGGVHENSYSMIGEITLQLRALSYHFRIPVVSAVQTNRAGYDTSDLTLDVMSDSMQTAFHADAVFGIFQVEGDKENNKINTKVLKNRYGGREGLINEYFINYKTLTLHDMCEVVKNDASKSSNEILNDIDNIK